MNAIPAIKYLQTLINSPPRERTHELPRDLRWCCSEHALVLSLALIECGKECHVGEGAVFMRLESGWESVTKHFFVVSDLVPPCVYDSAIIFKEICGVFPDCIAQPVAVHLQFGKAPASFLEYPSDHGVWYFCDTKHNPREYVTTTAPTPYGDWLASLNVKHGDFWLNAAKITAAILQGSIAPPTNFPDRQTLAEKTARGDFIREWI
jgi:hypothetical protein